MIDSHCHLAGEEFVADLDQVIERAVGAGVERAVVIVASDDDGEVARALDVRRRWPAVAFATGLHPHSSGKYAAPGVRADGVGKVSAALDALSAVALGEIGLDYHYDFAPRDVQRAVFEDQLDLAVSRDLPVVIHTREASDDTFAAVGQRRGKVRGVVHCFTGTLADARAALDLGFYISLSGIVTFPRAAALREVAAFVPADRLLVETDAPFLAPVPHRGARNEPAWVVETFKAVAGARGDDAAALASVIHDNTCRLFGVGAPVLSR